MLQQKDENEQREAKVGMDREKQHYEVGMGGWETELETGQGMGGWEAVLTGARISKQLGR